MQKTLKMEGETVTSNRNFCPSLKNIHVLVVDDDITTLAIVAGMIRTWTHEVRAVKDGYQAVDTLRRHRIDVVVADIYMPEMNGFELLKLVEREFKVPVILMSADDQDQVVLRTLKEGAVFFISKPVTPADFRNIWQYAFRKRLGYDEKITIRSPLQLEENKTMKPYKRKESEIVETGANDDGGDNSKQSSEVPKKRRLVWTGELQKRFLGAIEKYGVECVVPKKILKFMNVPGLTRENIASHLQKYRINVRKAAGIRNLPRSDFRSKFVSGGRRLNSKYFQHGNNHQFSYDQNLAGKMLKDDVTSLNNQINLGVPDPIGIGPFNFSGQGGANNNKTSSSSTLPSVFRFQAKGKQPIFPGSCPFNFLQNKLMHYSIGEPSGCKSMKPYEFEFGNKNNNAMEMNFIGRNNQALSNYGGPEQLLDPQHYNNNGKRLLEGSKAIFPGIWNNSSSGFMDSGNQFQWVQNGGSFRQPPPLPLQLPSEQNGVVPWNNVKYPQLQPQHLGLPPWQNDVGSSSNNILTTPNLDASGLQSLVEDDLSDTFLKQIDINNDHNQQRCDNNEVLSPNFPITGSSSCHVEENPQELAQIQNQINLQQGVENGQVDQASSPQLDDLLSWFVQGDNPDIAEALAGLNSDLEGNK